jgi:hypothetical protein
MAAIVFDIFESADQVGYAAEAGEAADDEGPDAERGCGLVYIYICMERESIYIGKDDLNVLCRVA